jgi:hypothetical protein
LNDVDHMFAPLMSMSYSIIPIVCCQHTPRKLDSKQTHFTIEGHLLVHHHFAMYVEEVKTVIIAILDSLFPL